MDKAAWERRLDRLWASIGERPEDEFLAAMDALVAERPPDDPIGLFEHASAFDSTGHPDRAVERYRQALKRGLPAGRRRRAVIQLASTLRNLGQADESVALLTAESRPSRTSWTTRSAPSWPSPSPAPAGSTRPYRWP